MDPKWTNEEQQHWFEELWEKVKPRLRNIITSNLELLKAPLIDDIFDIEPDWLSKGDWSVASSATRIHNCNAAYDEEEELLQFSGRLMICRGTITLLPSFKFILDEKERKLKLSFSLIKRLLIEKEKMDKDSAFGVFGEKEYNKVMLRSKPTPVAKEREAEIVTGFKFFGMNKDEAYLLLHDTVSHTSYSEKMDIGHVVKLGMDILNKKV